MKYRDPKTGDVFEDIGAKWSRWDERNGTWDREWARQNPAEATCVAPFMGYEVVDDKLYDSNGTCGICEKSIPDGYDGYCKCLATGKTKKSEDKCDLKETDMGKTDKPRICEVLGVEVDQPFNINYPCRAYSCLAVRPDGKVWETGPYTHKIGSNALYYLIEHKDEIIRKPRFTEEEVADAKALVRILGATGIERTAYGGNLCAVIGEAAKVVIGQGLFPSLRPGQSVKLSDITGECP